jgi:hypothetical protein
LTLDGLASVALFCLALGRPRQQRVLDRLLYPVIADSGVAIADYQMNAVEIGDYDTVDKAWSIVAGEQRICFKRSDRRYIDTYCADNPPSSPLSAHHVVN